MGLGHPARIRRPRPRHSPRADHGGGGGALALLLTAAQRRRRTHDRPATGKPHPALAGTRPPDDEDEGRNPGRRRRHPAHRGVRAVVLGLGDVVQPGERLPRRP